MHYYQFHIGDYQRDTMHLDLMEDLAYRRLLDLYYKEECPIPLDVERVAKLIRMRTHSECIASVLQEYFERTDSGWKNHRVEAELKSKYAKSESARQSANARWERKKAKERQQKQGVNANAMRTQCESDANGMLPNTQYPIPKTQKALVETSSTDAAFDVFWGAGLRKQNKKKAKQIFKRICGKEPMDFADRMANDIQARIKAGQSGIDMLHPSTYLNGERWNDEIPEPTLRHGGPRKVNMDDLHSMDWLTDSESQAIDHDQQHKRIG